MATVGLLVSPPGSTNNLRYLVTFTDATTLVITTTGAASPDLLTDTAGTGGVLRKLAQTFVRGYGSFAAGAQTQAKARALWLNDNSAASPGTNKLARARAVIVGRASATGLQPSVDANVDGGGNPTLVLTPPGAAGSCYLDISVPGAIGA